MKKKPITPEQVEDYDRLLATHPAIDRKGRNMLYTSVNGHMFTVFSTDAKLGIRLSKEDRAAFLKEHDSELLHTYGAVMREYVTVPDALLPKTKVLAPWLKASYAYVTSLPPKPTTKKKPTKKKTKKTTKKSATKTSKSKSKSKSKTPAKKTAIKTTKRTTNTSPKKTTNTSTKKATKTSTKKAPRKSPKKPPK